MLRLRPHHGMCIANFVGRGYDEVFTVNMNQTAEALKAEPQQEIWLKAGEDVLCSLSGSVCDIGKGTEVGSGGADDLRTGRWKYGHLAGV